MELMTAISAVSETLKITKELRQIDDKVAVAELKLRLVDIADGLLEAKEALQDAKERERQLHAEIDALKGQLSSKSRFEDEYGLLYQLDDQDERIGQPFYNKCFVKEERLFGLRPTPANKNRLLCDNCNFISGSVC